MNLQPRERLWLSLIGVLGALWGVNWLFQSALRMPQAEREGRIARLERDILNKQVVLRRARQDSAQLRAWEEQSLPANPQLARSLYQNWLVEVVERAGFEKPNVDSGEAVAKAGAYQRLPFSVRGRATLGELTKFLYEFYRADFLHQVQRLNITPVAGGEELDLSLTVEALALPGATRDTLNPRRSARLASDSLADYHQPLTERNVFSTGGEAFDPADFAFLTAILEIDGQAEAWFTVRTTGEILKLRSGQSFEIGQFHGVVVEIEDQDLVIDSDDERWLLTLGENLSQATALPPEY